MSTFLEQQNWRYATKKFDSTKKISTEDLNTLKEAIRLSSSSYGLQLYKVFIVENPALRAKIQPAAWGQSQIVDASHLIIFANQTTVTDEDIDGYLKNVAETRNIPETALTGYGDFMKSGIGAKSDTDKSNWTSKQTYLALANLMNAAAELKIDVTPMEGFAPDQVNEILGFNELGLNASLIAPIGYRSKDDATQFQAKVRKSNEELFITL
jgi:nitroreductase